jgi:hypothetical protein
VSLSVKDRGAWVATYRYIHVALMEMLARWVPTTPEMEVKLVFGSHIWYLAQHADALGKRTHELRLALQHSIPPVKDYLDFLEELGGVTDTSKRIAGVYDVMLPALVVRLRAYLDRTDHLMDAPTVRIVERILGEHDRMVREGRALREELPAVAGVDGTWLRRLAAAESAVSDPVAPVAPAVTAARDAS